jgi:hypothetical protein
MNPDKALPRLPAPPADSRDTSRSPPGGCPSTSARRTIGICSTGAGCCIPGRSRRGDLRERNLRFDLSLDFSKFMPDGAAMVANYHALSSGNRETGVGRSSSFQHAVSVSFGLPFWPRPRASPAAGTALPCGATCASCPSRGGGCGRMRSGRGRGGRRDRPGRAGCGGRRRRGRGASRCRSPRRRRG